MPTIVPPQSPPSPPPANGAPAPAVTTVTAPNPPPSLTRLALGALIDGRAVAQETKGLYQLQTPQGNFFIQTAVPLPKNAALLLQVQSLGQRAQLEIVSIDGAPPARFFSGRRLDAAGNPGTAKRPSLFPVNLTVGTKVRATFLVPLPGPPSSPNAKSDRGGLQSPPLKAPSLGAKGSVSFLKGAAPETGTKAAIANLRNLAAKALSQVGLNRPGLNRFAGSSLNAALRGGQASAGKPGTAGGRGLPAGTRVSVRIVAVTPGGPASAAPVRPPPPGMFSLAMGQTLSGKVIGATAQGRPIVQTHAGPISLETPSPLPKGANITLEIAGKALPPVRPDALPLKLLEGVIQSREWPALSEAMRILQAANPAAAQHLAQTLIPRPDAQLSANILFFVSALRGGDLKGWLGTETDRALGKAKSSLRARLGEEFKQLGRSIEETPARDFRVIPVPFMSGSEIEQIRLFIKQSHEEDEEDAAPEGGTHFVVDLDLSRLGRMQLDGRVGERNRRFELTIRSAHPLPGDVRNGIRAVFQQANEITGVKGAVSFQAAPPRFIEIPSGHGPEDLSGLIV